MVISSPWTFRHKNFSQGDILAQGFFGTMDVLARDISALEHFGTWIFWHLAKQYGRFGTDILPPVLLCWNVNVPKCPRAMVTKNPCAKKSLYRNVHRDKMSMNRNTYMAATCMCRNVPVMKCLCQNVSGRNVSAKIVGSLFSTVKTDLNLIHIYFENAYLTFHVEKIFYFDFRYWSKLRRTLSFTLFTLG